MDAKNGSGTNVCQSQGIMQNPEMRPPYAASPSTTFLQDQDCHRLHSSVFYIGWVAVLYHPFIFYMPTLVRFCHPWFLMFAAIFFCIAVNAGASHPFLRSGTGDTSYGFAIRRKLAGDKPPKSIYIENAVSSCCRSQSLHFRA